VPEGPHLLGRISRLGSLRARSFALAALGAALTIGAATVAQLKVTLRTVEDELLESARAVALGVAAELTERAALPNAAELEEQRLQFAEAVPELLALTVTRLAEGRTIVETSTEPIPPPGAVALAAQAVAAREIVTSEPLAGGLRLVAVPLERDGGPYGAVIASLSMERLERVRRRASLGALGAWAIAVVVIAAVVGLLGRFLVDRPLASILEAMQRTAAGDLQARAPVHRRDEIGAVAAEFNTMLGRVQDFDAALREEVRRATAELEARNTALADTARRLFAARRDLARAEHLAAAGRLARTVAHQVGTPLNLISGHVQVMREQAPPGSSLEPRLKMVLEQIARVTTIVQGFLDETRRPTPPAKQRIAPAEILQRVADLTRPALDAGGISLELRCEPGLDEVEVDAAQMTEAFLNLVANSIDAMPGGGALTLAARAAEGGVEITVTDTGTGIAAEHVGHVFDPLFTTKPVGKGTGLGLAIVRDVVGAHGGRAGVSSEWGAGTVVTISLPRAAEGTA
jgi:signal transduction histidine kinase